MKISRREPHNNSGYWGRSWLFLMLLSGILGMAACNQSTTTKKEAEKRSSTLQELQGHEKIKALNQKIHDQYPEEKISLIFAKAKLKAPHYPTRQSRDNFSSIEEQFEQWVSNYPEEYEAYIHVLSSYL